MKSFLLICLISLSISKVSFDLETVRKDLLDRHNLYRAKHQAPNLERLWALETIAQSYSEKLVSLGYLVHSSNTLNGNYIGENLYFGYNAGYLGTKPVDAWYDEIKDYDFAKSEFTSGTGHFTQVVWKNSKQVGCGVACGTNDYCYVTCNYYPGGNYLGQFRTNVLPLSDDTSSEDTTKKEEEIEDEETNDESVTDSTKEETTDAPVKEEDSELEKFRKSILEKHNYYRNLHQVGNLERDSTLESIAQKTAEYMKQIDNFYFAKDKYNGKPIGQNIFWYWGSFTGEKITDMWYDSESSYDYSNPKYKSDTGDFTQLVWKNTQKIGCGYACNGKECYGICTYYPAGNYMNQFANNVFPKK